jgi:hypothetical protein
MIQLIDAYELVYNNNQILIPDKQRKQDLGALAWRQPRGASKRT